MKKRKYRTTWNITFTPKECHGVALFQDRRYHDMCNGIDHSGHVLIRVKRVYDLGGKPTDPLGAYTRLCSGLKYTFS